MLSQEDASRRPSFSVRAGASGERLTPSAQASPVRQCESSASVEEEQALASPVDHRAVERLSAIVLDDDLFHHLRRSAPGLQVASDSALRRGGIRQERAARTRPPRARSGLRRSEAGRRAIGAPRSPPGRPACSWETWRRSAPRSPPRTNSVAPQRRPPRRSRRRRRPGPRNPRARDRSRQAARPAGCAAS
jgi:hypothetical protein